MEIGNQIKSLRMRRGITQEAMAQHFGITAQAVSKWERGVATPDIGLLPELSAYFGVTIDELFALSDETRMERIQNMLWDVRYLDPREVASVREFLLEKGAREPENGKVYDLLAQLENHLAGEHRERAEEYAKESLSRERDRGRAGVELVFAMNGKIHDWNGDNHYLLINAFEKALQEHPEDWSLYMFLMDQLIDDYRLEEASQWCDRFAQLDSSYRVPLYRGMIQWQAGNREAAFGIWQQMEEAFPGEWCVWHNVGDYLVRSGQWEKGMEYYRKALDVQKEPPLLDPLQAMAQLCEIHGDLPGAIAARKEELRRMQEQWHITSGEELDAAAREIARLEKKL